MNIVVETFKKIVLNNISIGDCVLEIKNMQMQMHDNVFAAQLLSSEILTSIRSYSPQNIVGEISTKKTNIIINSKEMLIASPINSSQASPVTNSIVATLVSNTEIIPVTNDIISSELNIDSESAKRNKANLHYNNTKNIWQV